MTNPQPGGSAGQPETSASSAASDRPAASVSGTADGSTSAPPPATVGPVETVRFLLEIGALVALAWWGFALWPLPWNIVIGIAAPVLFALIWGLFVAPKAVFRIDNYARSLVEILLMASAALALLFLGVGWLAAIFALLATITGFIVGLRRI